MSLRAKLREAAADPRKTSKDLAAIPLLEGLSTPEVSHTRQQRNRLGLQRVEPLRLPAGNMAPTQAETAQIVMSASNNLAVASAKVLAQEKVSSKLL